MTIFMFFLEIYTYMYIIYVCVGLRDIPRIGISLLYDSYIKLIYEYPYNRDVHIIVKYVLYGYPYNRDIPIIGISILDGQIMISL